MTKFDFWKWLISFVSIVGVLIVLAIECSRQNIAAIIAATVLGVLTALGVSTFVIIMVQKMQSNAIVAYTNANAAENKMIIEGMKGIASSMSAYSKMITQDSVTQPQNNTQSLEVQNPYLLAPNGTDAGLVIDMSPMSVEAE